MAFYPSRWIYRLHWTYGSWSKQNKADSCNGLENTAVRVLYEHDVCVFTTSLQKLPWEVTGSERKKQERRPVANGFPIGWSLNVTHNKKWEATGEQLLGNIRLYLLTQLLKQVIVDKKMLCLSFRFSAAVKHVNMY